MKIYLSIFVLLISTCLSLQQYERENVCTANPQTLGLRSELKSCYKMSHSKVYKSSSSREMIVELKNAKRVYQHYPLDFNITILRIWNGNYYSIDSCCSLEKPCKLPASDGAEYTIIAPTSDDDFPYCHETIHITRGMPEWCYINPKCPCVYLDKGVLALNDTYLDICGTSCSRQTKTDFCFFELPGRYGELGHKTDFGLTVDVQNVTLSRNRACQEGKMKEDLFGSLSSLFRTYNANYGNTVCAYYRMKTNYSSEWRPEPICLTEPVSFPWRNILIVAVISLIVLIALIGLAIVYKRHIKICFPSYRKTVEEMKSMKFDLSLDSENGSSKKYQKEKDIPTKILGNGDTPYRRISIETQRYVISPSANNHSTPRNSLKEIEVPIYRQALERVDEDVDQLSELTVETPCDDKEQDSREFFQYDRNNQDSATITTGDYMQKDDLHSGFELEVITHIPEPEFSPYQSKSFQSLPTNTMCQPDDKLQSHKEEEKLKAEQAFHHQIKLLSLGDNIQDQKDNGDLPDYVTRSQNPIWLKNTSPTKQTDWSIENDGYFEKNDVRFSAVLGENINKSNTHKLPPSKTLPQSFPSQSIDNETSHIDGGYISKNSLF